MTSRTRAFVLAVSIPVIAFAVIGGYLGQAMARNDTFRHLAVFEDVVSIVLNNYVEEVDVSKAMKGALYGLSEALDSDSAYLPPDLVKSLTSNESAGQAEVGIELIRQFYLRVVSVRDGSPAARAGLRSGDYVRVIGGQATRNMSTLEGTRLLQGAPGSTVELVVLRGNAADPHVLELVRERMAGPDVTSKMAAPGVGYLRMLAFSPEAVAAIRPAVERLTKSGASKFVIDVRGTARGDLDQGVAAARLFVKSGTLAIRESKDAPRDTVQAQAGDGAIAAPVVLLTSPGTSGAAEVFAAALEGRATRVGTRTLGRAARQRLIRLPDGSGLWLSYLRYLTPAGEQLHERGLTPAVEVEEPEVEFGSTPPPGDPALDRAIGVLAETEKKAA
ncbi:MAG: PDZ domain-containing protein [Acidimicrobiia bacterium]|nr:PDZ domain-containing protein [Acidimicrobiia bacterium]